MKRRRGDIERGRYEQRTKAGKGAGAEPCNWKAMRRIMRIREDNGCQYTLYKKAMAGDNENNELEKGNGLEVT